MYGPLRLSFALLANYVPKCQMSSGPHGPIFLELEYCPFSYCPKTFTDLQSNIYHQEEVHRSVKTWMCPICEINFVSEGCSTRHVLSFHRGPIGYAEDLNKVHENVKPSAFST